jgi:CheY-specific phosphatase CheX
MDVRFINPFIVAIKNIFSTMVRTEVTVGKPRVRTEELRSADVSGVIGLSGDATGAVVLSFPRVVACKVASMFAGAFAGNGHGDKAAGYRTVWVKSGVVPPSPWAGGSTSPFFCGS